ncbi:MAG: hypothetical protein O6746_05165, partial [Thaumarchaeota archaeon]|nr:hypothetical protein [Nitrososphaerota archaeon]
MKTYRWQVIEEFDPKKDYGQWISPRNRRILSLLKKDKIYLSKDFRQSHKQQILEFLRVKNDRAVQKAVESSFGLGFKIGV